MIDKTIHKKKLTRRGGEIMTAWHFYESSNHNPQAKKAKVWCKYCNCTPKEHEILWPNSDKIMFHDYLVAQGIRKPNKKDYNMGQRFLSAGDDYATTAFEISFRRTYNGRSLI